MVNTTSMALARANGLARGYGGLCLGFTSGYCYQAAPRFGSAIAAWNASTTKVFTSNLAQVPIGAPIWFAPHGSPYGHVAIYAGNGLMRTTNSVTGRIHTDPVSKWQGWGYRLLGWTRDIEGQPIPNLQPTITPTPAPITTITDTLGDDMALLINIRDNHAGYKKGDIILWQPAADIPFHHLPHPDAVNMVKQAMPGIRTVDSYARAPWIVRARQATPGAAAGYGKR